MIPDLQRLDADLRRLEPPAGGEAAALSPLERARLGAGLAVPLADLATDPPEPAWLAELPGFHARIREALARNPHLSGEWLLALARLPDGLAHVALAGRNDLPAAGWLALLHSPEATVRSRVLAEHGDAALLRAAVANRDPWLRAAAASRPDLAAEHLTRLATDPDARVRRRVAENPSTKQRILTRLGRDDDTGVRKAARAHPSWAPGWWERWWGR